ncbi:MAG: hypothetical protein RJA57_185 [Bacteroidota bacterium]|jgi:hypothetical protein
MLQFFSGSARIINTRRAVTECMELALGNDYANVDLIILHASIGHSFKEMVDQARVMSPGATILAASCCGVVGCEGVSESMKDMALMAIKGKDFAVASTAEITGASTYAEVRKMAEQLQAAKEGINMVYTLSSGIDIANDETIRAIEDVFGPAVTIFGATSSDNMKGVVNYQAVNDAVYEHGAFLVGFADPSLKVETQATHGFVAIGEPLIVTRSRGHVIEEFNGKPAWEEYTRRLALPIEATCGDSIPVGALGEKLSAELASEYGNSHILRVVTKREGNHMHYATTIAEGTALWLTVRDEDLIFREMDRLVADILQRMNGRQAVAVFHADCLARGRFLFNKIMKEELVSKMQHPFYRNGACPPWLGMYGFGEFARLGGVNTYHNYTTALYVLYR